MTMTLEEADLRQFGERQMTSLDNPGICLACGMENGCCEPDARKYKCEGCGEHAVYGAEELMMRIGL